MQSGFRGLFLAKQYKYLQQHQNRTAVEGGDDAIVDVVEFPARMFRFVKQIKV